MNVLRRLTIYALVTGVIQAVTLWLIFSLAHEQPAPIWLFYILYNASLFINNPLGQGPHPTAFFALVTGTMSMFFIICGIGETMNLFADARKRKLQTS